MQIKNPSIVRDLSKCVKCGRCVKVCKEVQGVSALTYSNRSSHFMVTTAYNKPLEDTDCTFCGQCSVVCPVGAIVELDDTQKVWEAIHDPKKHVIVQVAPAVRVAIGGIDPHDIVTVSIMPCTAKKYEATRPEMEHDGIKDVDIVITTRELIKMIKYVGLKFMNLPSTEFDSPLGLGTGAGAIFGTSGGVMEAALRTVYEVYTGEELKDLNFTDVRGYEGIKEASVNLAGTEIKVAIAHGLLNARKLMEGIKDGESPYTFIEIMACPGGCIGGGGQPVTTTVDIKKLRMDALYDIDNSATIRKSHENPDIVTLYNEYLGAPLSELSHELLHTHYAARKKAYDFSYLEE